MDLHPSEPSVVLIPLPLSDEKILYKAGSRHREARLRALLTDPGTFASSHEQEQAWPMETWTDRIQNKQAKTFLLVERHTGYDNLEALLDQPWFGCAILLGPKVKGAPDVRATEPPWFAFLPPHVPHESQDDSYPLPTLEYHLVGMFVLPEARGRKLGKKLVEDAVSAALAQGKTLGAESVKISVLVEINNHVALGLYTRMGFVTQKEEEFTDRKGERNVAYFMEQELPVSS
jgi:ribosomal protein S18 acetylase RimI-like enzyme